MEIAASVLFLFLPQPEPGGSVIGMAPHLPTPRPTKGRAAISNRTGRFEPLVTEPTDDGWPGLDAAPPDEPPRLPTTLSVDRARRAITTNTSPDVGFDRSINPYRGCEHGCIYCFARPTHAYLGLSAGLDFETRLFYKPDLPVLLDRELRAKRYKADTLALGANTDPYQPIERTLQLTRSVLDVLRAFRHPVGIITKSALVTRDIDILADMARADQAMVCVSVTTLDRDLARTLEPRAPTPARRLATIKALSQSGIPVAILASPLIPGLTDHELDAILEAGKAAGARSANTILLRVPLEIAGLMREWLETHAPHRAERVLSLLRQCHGGQLYQSDFGTRMRGQGPYADLLRQRFKRACARLGLSARSWSLDASRFAVPAGPEDQPDLFGS